MVVSWGLKMERWFCQICTRYLTAISLKVGGEINSLGTFYVMLKDIKQAWRDAAEAELTQREIEQFADDPPEELDRWRKLDADHDAIKMAYVADNHGTPSVAAVFENVEGELKALEFTLEEWIENDGNPREARLNRYCVTTDGDGAYARLRSHLLTFEVEPIERLEV